MWNLWKDKGAVQSEPLAWEDPHSCSQKLGKDPFSPSGKADKPIYYSPSFQREHGIVIPERPVQPAAPTPKSEPHAKKLMVQPVGASLVSDYVIPRFIRKVHSWAHGTPGRFYPPAAAAAASAHSPVHRHAPTSGSLVLGRQQQAGGAPRSGSSKLAPVSPGMLGPSTGYVDLGSPLSPTTPLGHSSSLPKGFPDPELQEREGFFTRLWARLRGRSCGGTHPAGSRIQRSKSTPSDLSSAYEGLSRAYDSAPQRVSDSPHNALYQQGSVNQRTPGLKADDSCMSAPGATSVPLLTQASSRRLMSGRQAVDLSGTADDEDWLDRPVAESPTAHSTRHKSSSVTAGYPSALTSGLTGVTTLNSPSHAASASASLLSPTRERTSGGAALVMWPTRERDGRGEREFERDERGMRSVPAPNIEDKRSLVRGSDGAAVLAQSRSNRVRVGVSARVVSSTAAAPKSKMLGMVMSS